MELELVGKIAFVNRILFVVRQNMTLLQKYFYCRLEDKSYLIVRYFPFTCNDFPEGTMEKTVIDKLNEVARLLILAQDNVEYVQKYFIAELKKEGRLPGIENHSSENPPKPE